jgi:CBS domain-containing protein
MCIKTIMSSSPDYAEPQETARDAAMRMRQRAVGSLIVINDAYAPVGIITDRDLMERVLAAGKDPDATRLVDIMTASPATIAETDTIGRALQLMREHSVRRLPVEDELGRVCGLVSLDDILANFAEKCQGIAQLLKSESPRGVAEASASRWE